MKHALQFSKIAFAAILFLFCSSQAYAVGLGFSAGIGSEKWKDDEEFNYRGDRQVTNGGFVLDTHVRRNKLFGYRLTILKENNDGGKLDMRGWATTHDFTFGLVRTNSLRFWVGPELKTTFYNKLTLNTSEEVVFASDWFSKGGLGDVWGFGVGPAIGLNIHLPETLTFTFTAAVLASNYNGDTDYSTTSGKQYGDLHVDSTGLYLTAGFILRINE
jgi:hypothetical protein